MQRRVGKRRALPACDCWLTLPPRPPPPTHTQGVTDYDKLKAHSIRFVEELCKDEVKTKGLKPVRGDKYSGLVCLVWLLRHLMFVTTFIKYLVELEPATPGECARRTYEEVSGEEDDGGAPTGRPVGRSVGPDSQQKPLPPCPPLPVPSHDPTPARRCSSRTTAS